MLELFNGFTLDVIEENNFVFLDCLTDVHGRKYIKLDDDERVRNEQLKHADYLSFTSIQAKDCGRYMILKEASKIDDFNDIRENRILQLCVETMRLVLKKHYVQLFLPILMHSMYLLRAGKICDNFILIKFITRIIGPIDLTSCLTCGCTALNVNGCYFNPITYAIECSACRKGESFEVKPRTLKEMQNLYAADDDKLSTINVAPCSQRYILFILIEAIAHRFNASKFLDDFLKGIK